MTDTASLSLSLSLSLSSALVLVTVNVPNPSPLFAPYIASLEVAHLWLFFVGLMFVLEAIILLNTSKTAQAHYTIAEKTSNTDLLMEEDCSTEKSQRSSACCIVCCGEWGEYSVVRHKTYKVVFRYTVYCVFFILRNRADSFSLFKYLLFLPILILMLFVLDIFTIVKFDC